MENKEEIISLEQAETAAEDKQEVAPEAVIDALQGTVPSDTIPLERYRELQGAFTKKSQALKELEQKVNSIPSREDIIREYLRERSMGSQPAVLTSSSSAFDFASEKKPSSLNEADRLAREFFSKK
jgi:hypothetical protein